MAVAKLVGIYICIWTKLIKYETCTITILVLYAQGVAAKYWFTY